MSVFSITMEKQLTVEGSSYHIRETYLQAIKQFMADEQNTFQPQINDEIEEYFLYEKQVSHHIQELLEHSDLKIPHN